MSQVIFIAFDEDKFKNPVNCERWLRNSQEYDSLLNNKRWRLKTVAKSHWMSEEGRKVFQWVSPTKLAYVKQIVVERPDPSVLIMKNIGTSYFTETELPPLSNKFQRAQREKEFQLALKDQKRLDKEEKKKQKKRKRDTTKIKEPIVAEGDLIKPKRRVPKKKKVPDVPISSDLPEFPLTEQESMQLKL